MERAGLSAAELVAVADLWKRTGRTLEARFTGDSMEPAIVSGARLRLLCGTETAPGDVAAFVHDGHVLVHRVLDVRAPFVLARGDALAVPDAPLPLECAFARVVAVQRRDDWIAPDGHRETAGQRLVRSLCAFRVSPTWARAVIALLRRLRRRPSPAVELLE
jgi:hypothetical protein